MKDDVISRQATIDIAKDLLIQMEEYHQYNQAVNNYCAELVKLPSAQPETAKRIVGKSRNGMTLWYQCDMCNEPVDAQDNFCRGCGRRLIDE